MDKIRLWYIFRIDDITPGMNRDNFRQIEKIFDTYWIKPIIGVVPDNKDDKLNGYWKTNNFRSKIKGLKDKWRIIAQHWYQHIYCTKNSWIIGLNNYSEFAWLPYSEQLHKIENGKKILEKNLWTSIKRWMAPAHSFDRNTCKALKHLWFEYITDGIAIYPFGKYWLKRLPQQIRKPERKTHGIRTICLHINKYNNGSIHKIEEFIEKNKEAMFFDPEKLSYKNNTRKKTLEVLFKALFRSKIYIYKIKVKLLW